MDKYLPGIIAVVEKGISSAAAIAQVEGQSASTADNTDDESVRSPLS